LRDVTIPANALAVNVAADGRVSIDTAERKDVTLGRITLATFAAPEALRSLGGTVFAATRDAGPPQRVVPGATVHLAFGALEKSNVSVIESMMAILTAQRAYEANAKGVQAADEMQRIANNLHRS
jgi:flagellar basal-body rod protein FlgG